MSSSSSFSSVTEGECLHLQKECASPWAGCARLAGLLPSNCHCYYSMQRRTHMKQRRAECPLNVLQMYTRQSKTTSTITSKSFEKFRRHFLRINFWYNVRFLTSTVEDIVKLQLESQLARIVSSVEGFTASISELLDCKQNCYFHHR